MERAERALADLDAGRLHLAITGGDARLDIDVTFAPPPDGDLPLLEVAVTESAGGVERTTTLRSDGETVTVSLGGDERTVPAEVADRLRLDDAGGVAALGFAAWLAEPVERERGDGTVVTGAADVAAVLRDVSRLGDRLGALTELDADDADRIARAVTSSAVEVVVGGDDLPRSIEVTIEVGDGVPEVLADAFGVLAGPTLDVLVEISEQPR